MCTCLPAAFDRRRLLSLGAGALAATTLAGTAARAAGAYEGSPRSPDHSLEGLIQGNGKFVSEPQLCEIDLPSQRAHVAEGQTPWASILSCADSRVPPEIVFGGRQLGEIFVARNAGNLADTATIGTLEYGAGVLGSPLIVVLGHARCGAVKAACEVVESNATFPGAIGPMIYPIIPAVLAVRDQPGDLVANATRENARRTVRGLIKASAMLSDLVDEGKLKAVAAFYHLDTGKVEYLD